MTIAWKRAALPLASKARTDALNALLNAGHHNPPQDRIAIVTVRLDTSIDPKAVITEITKQEHSHNPLARAIVDGRLGAAVDPDTGPVLRVYTTEPQRAATDLLSLQVVRQATIHKL